MTVREALAELNALPPEVLDFEIEVCYGDGEPMTTFYAIRYEPLETPNAVQLLTNEI